MARVQVPKLALSAKSQDPSGSTSPSTGPRAGPVLPTNCANSRPVLLTLVLFRSFTELQQGHSIHQLEVGVVAARRFHKIVKNPEREESASLRSGLF